MRKGALLLAVCLAAAAAAGTAAVVAVGQNAVKTKAAKVRVLNNLWFELVGQFKNSDPGVTPATHIHYGYLSWVQGVSAFGAPPQSLTTAQFTFFADGKSSAVMTNGPLRFLTRVGTLTIYRDTSRNSDFSNPDTFRDGTPVLVATYRHEPISSSLTGAISLFSHDKIVRTRPFNWERGRIQLGAARETFDEHYVGQNNMPGPPSGYFVGYDVGP